MQSTISPPEVSELLERFTVKKATVKTRLNDMIDDVLGDFLGDFISEIGRFVQCPKCSASAVQTPSDGENGKSSVSPKSTTSSSQAYLESTIRSAQARARDLIKEEFYDSDPVSRLSQKVQQQRSLLEVPVDDDDAPEITLTPIDGGSSTSAPLSIASTSTKTEVAANGFNGSDYQNNNSVAEEYESDEEFSCADDAVREDQGDVKSENGHPDLEEEEEEEEVDDDEEEDPQENGLKKGHSSDSQDAVIGEKSLEELNTLCSGLPYEKHGGKYICQFQNCGQELKSRHNLLLHQRAHLGIRPYRCKWPACNYNSNQSSAVIRHIRTKHFLLPLTMREQQMKKIEDDRDPKEYLEVMAADGPGSTSASATPEQGPGSVEPSSDSLQSCPENVHQQETPNHPTLRSSITRSNGKGRKLSVTPQQQSLLMPQQQHTNGKSTSHQNQQAATEEDSDEDEYDSDENDFEVIPMRNLQRAQQQIAMQNAAAMLMQQQLAAQQQQAQQQLISKSPFDYARKRRLESKIFANASISNRNRLSGGAGDYYGNGPMMKRPKSTGLHFASHQQPGLKMEPLAAHGSSKGGQHQYSFCPEEGCNSIFRTKNELDRHLTDVHNRLPQPKVNTGPPPQGPPKEPQTYSNLYICRWPKCPFSTVLHSSAINHVRGKHFNIPRTMTAQQRKMYANDTRNANDYIKLLPFAK